MARPSAAAVRSGDSGVDRSPNACSGSVGVDGATLRYRVEGQGVPLLVVGSSIYYPRTFSRRLRESCRFAFTDLRHFAADSGTGGPDRLTPGVYAEDMEKLRSALGLEHFVLIGHSHHGNVALEYAVRFPERVSHLVLIGTPPCDVRHTIETGNAYWEARAGEARKAILRRNLAALAAREPGFTSPGEAFVARYVAEAPRYWADPMYDASWLWQGVPVNMAALRVFRDFFSDYSFAGRWPPPGMPVLAVTGRHDYVVPPVLWDDLRSTLPNLTLHLFANSGHTPQLEEPALFDEVFLKWLGRHRAAAPA
jgi:proline iminopeptidase